MLSYVEVFRRMLVLARVAAADVATGAAQAQMHPGVARFQTVLTPPSARRDFVDLVKVRTDRIHRDLPFFCSVADASRHGDISHSIPGVGKTFPWVRHTTNVPRRSARAWDCDADKAPRA